MTKESRFKSGNKGGPGRPKGAKNKVPREFRDAVMFVFENFKLTDKDGVVYSGRWAFKKWCEANPEAFYTKIMPKLLPKPVEVSGQIEHKATGGFVIMPPKVSVLEEPKEEIDITEDAEVIDE